MASRPSFNKFLECVRKRSEYGQTDFVNISLRLGLYSMFCPISNVRVENWSPNKFYEPIKADAHVKPCHATENGHVLGVGLKVLSLTRSRQLNDYLQKLGISPTYGRILRIETKLSEPVLKNMTQTAVYVPGGLINNQLIQQPVFFAADNIDCDEDRPTPDGKSTLHDTILYLYFSLIVIPMQVRSQICHLISNTQH